MKALAVELLQADDAVLLHFAIRYYLAFNQKNKNAYETALASASLFIRERAGFERFLLMGGWHNQRDAHNAGLTLLMYLTAQTCGASCDKEMDINEFAGIDRIWFAPKDQPFVRFLSRSVARTDKMFKAKIICDISLNFCTEYIESSWSTEKIERAVWGLEYDLIHFTRQTCDDLKFMNRKNKLDLPGFEPSSLMTLSICGVVYFQGRNECAYELTGDPLAPIVVNGNLPKTPIKDLEVLHLVKEVRKGQ